MVEKVWSFYIGILLTINHLYFNPNLLTALVEQTHLLSGQAVIINFPLSFYPWDSAKTKME